MVVTDSTKGYCVVLNIYKKKTRRNKQKPKWKKKKKVSIPPQNSLLPSLLILYSSLHLAEKKIKKMVKPAGKKGAGRGRSDRDKKPFKQGKKVFKEKKQEYLKKQLKNEIKKNEQKKREVASSQHQDTVTVAWKGKNQEIDKKKLTADPKGRQLLKKISQKRVLSADEKHHLKMLGSAGDLMRLSEILREKSRPKADKDSAINQIMEFCKDSFADDVRKPDMSRIFQSVLKWSSPEVRTEMYTRVKGQIVELISSSYSNQYVKSLLEYAPVETRTEIFNEVLKAGGKILSQKNALPVLEHIYGKSNAEKQNTMLCSFFDGIEVKTFTGYPKLPDMFDGLEASNLDYKRLVERLLRIVSPSITKGSFDNVIVHRLLELLLKYGTDFEVEDIMEEVSKGVVNICRTKPGSSAALSIFTHADPRTRKSIIKSFQHSVVDMCCAKSTSFFFAKVFDLFDDTDYLCKSVVKEMDKGMSVLVTDSQGSIPLLHLLTPEVEQKKKYFTFTHFDTLWNDSVADPTTLDCLTSKYTPQKKQICTIEPKKKHAEVLAVLIPSMVQALMTDVDAMVENTISRRVRFVLN